VKFAIACAMLLAFFGPSAAASDDRELALVSAPVPISAAAPNAVATTAPASTSASAPAKTPAALPNAPSPTEPTPVEPATAELTSTNALIAPPAALITLKTAPRHHSFFDARNSLGLASLGASLTADALSTQKGLAYPGFREMNPIARPFVQSRAGAVAYNAGSFGLLAGTMYLAHKTQHHRLEHILPFAVAGWEGLLSFRNYRVIANRPR
jgi:hypothetical protein